MRRFGRPIVSEGGFGMVSVLVAVVLLSAGVVVLSSSSLFLTSLQTDSQVRSTASSIALAYMEEVKTRERSELASEETVRVNRWGEPQDDGPFVRKLYVETDDTVTDAVEVRVVVRYQSGMGRPRSVEIVTVIYVGN
jgi:Tfp pilus assembly protein PilV